ncbi:MAG: amidohydrolase [Anaerolineales bacterium]|jgi:5-methylthioadenosine/S-adenosylhomocysteine deaminase
MSKYMIAHGALMTVDKNDTMIADGAVVIAGDRIEKVGTFQEISSQYPDYEVIDATGMVVMPGFVNTHTHLSMTMTRSIADDIDAFKWLPVIWAVEKNISEESVYAGAMLGIAEMIASGTTCFNDHYFMMGNVAKAVDKTGIRADLAEAILENRNRKKGQEGLRKNKEFTEEWHGRANGRIRARIGPHALYTCSTDLVVQARQLANELGVGMHMHVAESALEMKLVGKKAAGETSVQHLHALDILGPDFVIAHGLTINEKDIEILASIGTGISHCPQAYGKVGGWPFPPVDEWIEAGINVGLGSDGVASNNNMDMIDEMRTATFTRKLFARDGRVLPARQVIRMATQMGADVLGLGDEIGSLEEGKKADIILVDFRKPHLRPYHNIPGHLVYSASGADVDTVIVDGQVLMKNRQFLTLDIDDVLDQADFEFNNLLRKARWEPTIEDPRQSLVASLGLKLTQQSVRVMSILAGESEPEEEELL